MNVTGVDVPEACDFLFFGKRVSPDLFDSLVVFSVYFSFLMSTVKSDSSADSFKVFGLQRVLTAHSMSFRVRIRNEY